MKTRSAIHLLCSLFVVGTLFISSCKKKDPEPAPSANTDNVDMGTDATVTIDVLANDSYKGSPSVSVSANTAYGTVVVNSDKTITYTPKVNFYGTATFTYTVNDENGSSSGSIVIKVGNDAQIRTSTILKSYVNESILWLYAYDGDSSRIYEPGYAGEQILYMNFGSNELIISSQGIIPNVTNQTYSILSDGNFYTTADNSSPLIFEIVDHFTALAKKRDGSGYMTVKGFTINYNGHTLDYSTRVD